jgi:hypothetical protein
MTTQDPIQRRLIAGLILYECVVITAVAMAGVSIATAGGSPVIAAVPVLVVAASEALRVPLSAWATRLTWFNRLIAIFVLGCLAIASAEGLSLAFDNLIAARTKIVREAGKRVDVARAGLATVEHTLTPVKAALASAEHEVASLDSKYATLIATPPTLPGFSGTVCRNRRGNIYGCPADAAAQKTYAATRVDYARQIDAVEAGRKSARQAVADLQAKVASIDIAVPSSNVALAERDLADALEASAMHRIAASWFAVKATDLTDAQFATFRKYAVTGLSLALASMSALVAWLAFQPARSDKPSKLSRAVRAYIARRRKPLVRLERVEVPVGTKIIYRYVPRDFELPATGDGPMGDIAFHSEKIRAYQEML